MSILTPLQSSGCSILEVLRRWHDMAGIKFAALDAASPLGSYLNEAELLLLARSCSVRGFKEGESLPEKLKVL